MEPVLVLNLSLKQPEPEVSLVAMGSVMPLCCHATLCDLMGSLRCRHEVNFLLNFQVPQGPEESLWGERKCVLLMKPGTSSSFTPNMPEACYFHFE